MAESPQRGSQGSSSCDLSRPWADNSKPQQGHWWDVWPHRMPAEAGPAELTPVSRKWRKGSWSMLPAGQNSWDPGPVEGEPRREAVFPPGVANCPAIRGQAGPCLLWAETAVSLSQREREMPECLNLLTRHTICAPHMVLCSPTWFSAPHTVLCSPTRFSAPHMV